MDFHVPHNGEADDEEIYQDLVHYLKEELGHHVNTDNRYRHLRYKDDGDQYVANVGEVFDPVDEVVLAIFEGGFMFYICTQTRGVPGSANQPVMVDKPQILRHKTFD